MMTDKQKRTLKRVITYSDLLKYETVGLLATVLVWGLLMMIDDLVLDNPGAFTSGGVILLVVLVIYAPLMLIHGIYVRVVTAKEDWLDMVEKAKEVLSEMEENDETEHGSTITKAATAVVGLSTRSAIKAAQIANIPVVLEDMTKKNEVGLAMAALFDVEIRFRHAAKLALVVPLIVLGVAFGVRCLDAVQIKEAAYTAAGSAVDALVDTFSESCASVISHDPYEEYRESGYSISCYIEDPGNDYISVKIDNSGLITEVYYRIAVDVDATKEENLIRAEELLSQMYPLVISSGVEAQSDELLAEPMLTDTFKESFLEGSYYDHIYENTDTFALYYSTYDEGSYFRVSMES